LEALEEALARAAQDVSMNGIFQDLAHLLGLPTSTNSRVLGLAMAQLGPLALSRRLRRARTRLIKSLVDEIQDAIRGISLEGLGVDHRTALSRPQEARRKLEFQAGHARKRWLASRTVSGSQHLNRRRLHLTALQTVTSLQTLAASPLFKKKRAAQASRLLAAWKEVSDLCGRKAWLRLRAQTLGCTTPWDLQTARLSGGASVARGLRAALLQHQGRFLASQVAEVAVCGAIPPYGPLLGGKLAALLALSREPAQHYYERYDGQVSEICSQMAGKPVKRSADLVALTTTSFYGVGSSQYERVRLPDGVGWSFVGYSRGHGTLHFSSRTSEILQALVRLETGRDLNTSTFGEGPSERLRKLREGLARLGLDESNFLQHGMPRRVFVSEFRGRQTRPGARGKFRPWRTVGPGIDEVTEWWRRRWLGPRLDRSQHHLDEVRGFSREQALLSYRLTRLAGEGMSVEGITE
jgi:hypothetical protein